VKRHPEKKRPRPNEGVWRRGKISSSATDEGKRKNSQKGREKALPKDRRMRCKAAMTREKRSAPRPKSEVKTAKGLATKEIKTTYRPVEGIEEKEKEGPSRKEG